MTTKKPPSKSLDMHLLEQCAAALRVLAHPHRLKMVELLMDQKLTVGQLALELDLPPNAVSQHLNHMKAHGILGAQRQGRSVYYKVINPNATNIIRCIRRHGHGEKR